jgi:hypothetical protein
LRGRYSERFLFRYGYYTISNYPTTSAGLQFPSYPSGFLGERFCRWSDERWLQRESTCELERHWYIPTRSLDALSSTGLVLASAYLPYLTYECRTAIVRVALHFKTEPGERREGGVRYSQRDGEAAEHQRPIPASRCCLTAPRPVLRTSARNLCACARTSDGSLHCILAG